MKITLGLAWLVSAAICKSSSGLQEKRGLRSKGTFDRTKRELKKKKSNAEIDTKKLQKAVTLQKLLSHLEKLQDIANRNGGNRSTGNDGYDRSVDYVKGALEKAGYYVSLQEFQVEVWSIEEPIPYFAMVSPSVSEYTYSASPEGVASGFMPVVFSGSNTLDGVRVQNVDLLIPSPNPNDSTSGCEPSDFEGFVPGNVALIQRGSCFFSTKVENAIAAGAAAVVIFNEGQEGRTDAIPITIESSLGGSVNNIPVFFASYDVGQELAGTPGATVNMFIAANTKLTTSVNIIAETEDGSDDSIVVVSAHLDSVAEGPGINDNGSGTSAILETAIQMSRLGIKPKNKIKFVWFGAEEDGLYGSLHFINLYKEEQELGGSGKIALNLNFDMIASQNGVRFVPYDPLFFPAGSESVAKVLEDFFDEQDLPWERLLGDDSIFRTDYFYFQDVGIPGSSIFTGAEEIKTEEQAEVFGGVAGEAYDKCYHLECDVFDNLDHEMVDQNADAIAHTIMTIGLTEDLVSFLGGLDDGMSPLSVAKTKYDSAAVSRAVAAEGRLAQII